MRRITTDHFTVTVVQSGRVEK
jgi:hypothetical protein